MLAWNCNKVCACSLVVGAVLLLIKADADHTYKVCPKKTISVGTRVDKKTGIVKCIGCEYLRNCVTLFGSLHINGISFANNSDPLRQELWFPKLREITGNLMVTFVDHETLGDILPNLAVIHGRLEDLFQGFALVVYLNAGLRNLGLNSLTLINNGGVKIELNQKLCYLHHVRWESLLNNRDDLTKDLALNGNSKDCFAKCSASCRTPSGHGSSGHTYCWGRKSKSCQKLCHSNCGSSGCEHGSIDKCCHKECLGGCTKSASPHHCNACQNLRILNNGTCVEACPPGLKQMEDFVCIPCCPDKIRYEHSNICYKECPAGYTKRKVKCDNCSDKTCAIEGYRHTCEECTKRICPRVCPPKADTKTFKINLLSDSARLKGCTVLDGALEIEIRTAPGGINVAQVLTEHLGSIEVVKGYVLVRQSTPLISLNFFKNLQKIYLHGYPYGFTDANKYALAIFDNPNLETLWDFHPNFTIENDGYISRGQNKDDYGGVFLQLNPRLCLNNVFPFVEDVLKWNRTAPNVAISETTNGNAKTCDVHLVNITITANEKRCGKELCVRITWPNPVGKVIRDNRDILLYSVWYRETTTRDLNEYDDIDACNSDHVWSRIDLEPSGQKRNANITLDNLDDLKAYTLYAFRLDSVVIAGRSVKSPIVYFQTKQTKPSMPRGLEVSFLSASSLQVKWKKPFFPNGNITHYVIRYKESETAYMWNMNIDWCESSFSFYHQREHKDPEKEVDNISGSCSSNITCDCDNGKDKTLTPDLKEALFSKEFQNKIISQSFTKDDSDDKKNDKNKNKAKTTPRVVRTTATVPNVVRNGTNSTSHGCGSKSKNSSCSTVHPNANASSTAIPITNVSTTPKPEMVWFQQNTTSQTIILRELKFFTEYIVEVCACNEGAGCGENKKFRSQCATAVGRTENDDTADNVGDTLNVTADSSSKKFILEWESPVKINGIVLKYDVWIVKDKETHSKPECVRSPKTKYIKSRVSPGEYSARVRAITPVGNGSWSNQVNFEITEQPTPAPVESVGETIKLETVVGVSIAIFVVVVVVLAAVAYTYMQRQKKKENVAGVLFSSTNPEYWNCSEVYVPDEWEVQRKDVTLIRELGNGSFGMVWEGEAVGILPGVDCCKVAVKTVSDNSSIRDKVEFLKEASIMKAFNCNHVLRLLGVVSAGDPVLVIMELMENGDLKSFLRRRRPDLEDSSFPPPTDIELYQMAAEIADGMAYLAARKFVHRDLAARNCMVSANFTCKIGDFGMARDVYETDYYRKGGKGFLPVRWMAPESLKDGVFCSASDAWSYGVVLWEMATLAEQPYQGKSNEEVMKYVLDGNLMSAPESCPQLFVEIMNLCWQYKDKLRPSFISIVKMLDGYLSIEFTERSFYHNGRCRNETDSSCLSLGTENDRLSELADDPNDEDFNGKESFV